MAGHDQLQQLDYALGLPQREMRGATEASATANVLVDSYLNPLLQAQIDRGLPVHSRLPERRAGRLGTSLPEFALEYQLGGQLTPEVVMQIAALSGYTEEYEEAQQWQEAGVDRQGNLQSYSGKLARIVELSVHADLAQGVGQRDPHPLAGQEVFAAQGIDPASQSTSLHHRVRVAALASRQAGGFNADVILALTHEMFDNRARKGFSSETVHTVEWEQYAQALQEVLGQESYSSLRYNIATLHAVEVAAEWSGLDEIVPETFDQSLTLLTGYLAEMSAWASDDLSVFQHNSTSKEVFTRQLAEIEQQLTDCRQIRPDSACFATLKTQVTNFISQFATTPAMRVFAADATDHLLIPRRPEVGNRWHPSTVRDAEEAKRFVIPVLEWMNLQPSLRTLKDSAMRVLYPEAYENLARASENLRQQEGGIDYFGELVAANALVLEKVAQDLQQRGYHEVAESEVQLRILQLRGQVDNYADFYDDVAKGGLLKSGEYFVYTRVKGFGSILDKVFDPKKRDDYEQAVIARARLLGLESTPTYGSVDFFQLLLPVLPDVIASRVIVGASSELAQNAKEAKLAELAERSDLPAHRRVVELIASEQPELLEISAAILEGLVKEDVIVDEQLHLQVLPLLDYRSYSSAYQQSEVNVYRNTGDAGGRFNWELSPELTGGLWSSLRRLRRGNLHADSYYQAQQEIRAQLQRLGLTREESTRLLLEGSFDHKFKSDTGYSAVNLSGTIFLTRTTAGTLPVGMMVNFELQVQTAAAWAQGVFGDAGHDGYKQKGASPKPQGNFIDTLGKRVGTGD